jgi:hypothetical protein
MNSCDDISLIFGVPMMLGIGIVFFFSIFSNFTAYMDIAGEGKLSPLTISSVVFALYYGGFVVVVVFVCSRVTSEVSWKWIEWRSIDVLFILDQKHSKNIEKTSQTSEKSTRNFIADFLQFSHSTPAAENHLRLVWFRLEVDLLNDC